MTCVAQKRLCLRSLIKMVEEGIKTLRRENNKNCGGRNKKKLRREISLKRERGK